MMSVGGNTEIGVDGLVERTRGVGSGEGCACVVSRPAGELGDKVVLQAATQKTSRTVQNFFMYSSQGKVLIHSVLARL